MNMKIELEKHPRYREAPDEGCIWNLVVNGFVLGAWYGGKNKYYEDKEKWAKTMIKKRVPVLNRNIQRLEKELELLRKELNAIT
jgi:hypothetical protein